MNLFYQAIEHSYPVAAPKQLSRHRSPDKSRAARYENRLHKVLPSATLF